MPKTKIFPGYSHITGMAEIAIYPEHGTAPIAVHSMPSSEFKKHMERMKGIEAMMNSLETATTQQEEKA